MCRVKTCKEPLDKRSSYFCEEHNRLSVMKKREILGISEDTSEPPSETSFVIHSREARF